MYVANNRSVFFNNDKFELFVLVNNRIEIETTTTVLLLCHRQLPFITSTKTTAVDFFPQFSFFASVEIAFYVQFFTDFVSWVDIYAKFITMAVNEEGVTLEHPVRIGMHYLRTSFVLDFISSFPFEFYAAQFFSPAYNIPGGKIFEQQSIFCNLFGCVRLLQLYKVIKL